MTLLGGEGLNRSTVEKLLRPESLLALKAILTDHLIAQSGRGTREDRCDQGNEPGNRPADDSDHDGDARRKREDDRANGSSHLFRTEE